MDRCVTARPHEAINKMTIIKLLRIIDPSTWDANILLIKAQKSRVAIIVWLIGLKKTLSSIKENLAPQLNYSLLQQNNR